jgi:S-DNA-T family DNA segregation ATPase FtsK/SpoIIIE
VSATSLSRRINEFLGVTSFALALLWLIALTTYDVSDTVWIFNTGGEYPPTNFFGQVGAFIAELSYQTFGYASFLMPVTLVITGWNYFWCRPIDAAYTKLLGGTLLFGTTAALLSLSFGTLENGGRTFDTGGYFGSALSQWLAEYFNRTGSIIVILTGIFLSIILSTQFSFGRFFTRISAVFVDWINRLSKATRNWLGKRRRNRQRRTVENERLEKAGSLSGRADALAEIQTARDLEKELDEKRKNPIAGHNTPEPSDLAGTGKLHSPGTQKQNPSIQNTKKPRSASLPFPSEDTKLTPPGSYTRPPVSLFDSPKAAQKVDERKLMTAARLLEEKCQEFSVDGAVEQIHPGPVVTTFEFKPDSGVKYNKIAALADDLSLAMGAERVLIERIPGKSTVGIQIPNAIREQISLRELLESELYTRSVSKLTLVLGRTIHGEPVTSDLATMPHLLIAGATGTGKSVALNSMLTSILYRSSPADVRLILIDPKRLELGMYEDIPHLLTPVVVEPKQANNALRWAVKEMENRYKHLATEGVRNIEQYNRNIHQLRQESLKPNKNRKSRQSADENDFESIPEPLPYIVVAIDELADLMMVASKEVEQLITRLAQMARAVGIHLILATQRPSVDVITGVIKANLPSRVAFRVSSKVDSRTILDANGAEQLLGKGDMLFHGPASSFCQRIHGPYISEQETARFCSFLRKQGTPGYDESITADEVQLDAPNFDRDELYDQASRLIVSSGKASISYLQRRLSIGFSRAARLVDMMEADGIVSGGTSGKPRELLVKSDYFDEIDARLN